MNSDQQFALILILFFGGVMPFALAFLFTNIKGRLQRLKAEADHPALLEELDHLRHRVGELEERVDFAERMLARQHEVPQIPGETR